jgi:hypothetical protein
MKYIKSVLSVFVVVTLLFFVTACQNAAGNRVPVSLTFRDPSDRIIADNSDIKEVSVVKVNSEYCISIIFTEEGTERFAKATSNLIGSPISIYLDNDMLMSPFVNSAITDGIVQISGGYSKKEAEKLTDTIKYGRIVSDNIPENSLTTEPFKFELTGELLDVVELDLLDRQNYYSLDAFFDTYLDAVKNEIEKKKTIKEIKFLNYSSIFDTPALSKEGWDELFQFISDNQYTFKSITFGDNWTDDIDINDIQGIYILSNVQGFNTLCFMGNNTETTLITDFPDLLNISYLRIENLHPDIIKHFSNIEEIYYNRTDEESARALIKNSKYLKLVNDENFQDVFIDTRDNLLKEDFMNYKTVTGTGIIDKKFTVTNTIGYGNLSTTYSKHFNAKSEVYKQDYRGCDYYVQIYTENKQYYCTYENGLNGYSHDYYMQIFDIKDKIAYEKTFIATTYPPHTITIISGAGNIGDIYGDEPVDEILAFIENSIEIGE